MTKREGMSRPLSGLREVLREARETQRRSLERECRAAGGPGAWLAALDEELATSSPKGLTSAQLALETPQHYAGAAERLAACRRCPRGGGACADDATAIDPGHRPVWREGRLVTEPCDRWSEYRTRVSLSRAGVPAPALSRRFTTWDQSRPGCERALAEVCEWLQGVVEGHDGWAVVCGPPRSGKSHLAIAAARNFVRHGQRVVYRFTPLLLRDLKQFVHGQSPTDPTRPLLSSGVAIVELHSPTTESAWSRDALEKILYERESLGLPTLLTSRDDSDSLQRVLPGLMAWSTARFTSLEI